MPKLKLKAFQIDDYARAAMRDGCILAHDTGLGKSLAAFAVPLIKDNVKRVLLVAPESLHLQLRETARNFFGVSVLPLMSQEQFHDWGLNLPAEPLTAGEKPAVFLTTYQALGHNGGDEWPADKDEDGEVVEVAQLVARRKQWLLDADWGTENPYNYDGWLMDQVSAGIGREVNGVRCVWTPTLARLIQCHDSFDFVVVDEGVRLQSNDAHIATGVRMLNPRHRLVLSATPIKNRLESLFWLAWWAAGGSETATPRWPYAGTSEQREKFASEHLLTDKFLTREKEKMLNGVKTSVTRRSARITNLHRLWKIVAPVVIRRRKANCGEEIVLKTTHLVRIKPGTDQWRVYQHYLNNPPTRKDGTSTSGAQLMLLRQATVAPFTELMRKSGEWSQHQLNPKTVAITTIVEQCLRRGEQVVIGSNFIDFATSLHRLLTEAGVWTCLVDGRVDPAARGLIARDFKDGRHSVMIAGVQAMGEGHSFEQCPNLILPSLDFAYDINSQFVDRVWRLTSKKPVNVYVVATENSVDEYLHQVYQEKEDSSQLALDGALLPADRDESSINALLAKAIKGFKTSGTIDESGLAEGWHLNQRKLAEAQKLFAKVNSSQ